MNRLFHFRLTILVVCLAAVGYGQEVIDSIDVGGWNVAGLVYNARAGVVYGGCYYGHSFFAIACSTNEIVSQIELVRPYDCAYSVTSNKAYCGFSNHGEDSILVVDGSTHTRTKAIPVIGTGHLVWDSAGDRLYTTCYYDDCVAVVDCGTDSVIGNIPVPGEPVGLTINARQRKLYVQNDYDMTVSVIDMETNSIIRNVHVGNYQFAACYSAVADKYYCNGAAGVAVIDGAGDTLIRQIALPQGYLAKAMVSVETESLVMVATSSGGSDSVFMIDVTRDSIRSAVRVGRQPLALAYSPVAHVVYSANSCWDDLSVIAGDGSRVLGQVPVSDIPQALLVCPEQEKLYVGHGGATSMVYVVRDVIGIEEPSSPVARGQPVLRAVPSLFVSRVRLEGATAGIAVHAQDGRLLRRLRVWPDQAGCLVWDGKDERGCEVPAGVYFAVAEGAAGGRVRLVKLR